MPYNVAERLIFWLQGRRLRNIKLLPAKPFGISGELAYFCVDSEIFHELDVHYV